MKRLESINEILKAELSRVIDRELDFPDGALVTITRVDTSDDKQHARVFFSLLGNTSETIILGMFQERVPFIQKLINKRLRVRPIPRIRFVVDEDEKKRETIERILGDNTAALP